MMMMSPNNNDNNNTTSKDEKEDALANLFRRGLTMLRQGEFYTAYGLEENTLYYLLPLPNLNDKRAPLHTFLRAVSRLEEEEEEINVSQVKDDHDETKNRPRKKKTCKEKLAELMSRWEEWAGLIETFITLKNSRYKILKCSTSKNPAKHHDEEEKEDEFDDDDDDNEGDVGKENKKRKLNAAPQSPSLPQPPVKKAKQLLLLDSKKTTTTTNVKELLEQKRNQAKAKFEAQKKKILQELPIEVKQLFRQVGFVQWTKAYLPVLIVSPFDVPPGPVRQEWMRMFEHCKKQGRLKDMTNLVYWYGSFTISQAYSFEVTKNFVQYDDGVSKGYDKIPPRIQELLDRQVTLHYQDADLCRGLQEIAEDAVKDPSERMRGIIDFPEEYDLITEQDVLDVDDYDDDSGTGEGNDDDHDEKEETKGEEEKDDPTTAQIKMVEDQLIAVSELAPTPKSPTVVSAACEMEAIGETEISDVDDEGVEEPDPSFAENDDDHGDDFIPTVTVKKIPANQTNKRKLTVKISMKPVTNKQDDSETEKETIYPEMKRQKKQAANEVQSSKQSKEQKQSKEETLTDPRKAGESKHENKPVSYKRLCKKEQKLFDKSASRLISPPSVPQAHLNEDGSTEYSHLQVANQQAPSQRSHASESRSRSCFTIPIQTIVPIDAEMLQPPFRHPPIGDDDDHGLYTATAAGDGDGAGSQSNILTAAPDILESPLYLVQIKIESDEEGAAIPDGASEADTSILPAAVPRSVDESTTKEEVLPPAEQCKTNVLLDNDGRLFNQQLLGDNGSRDKASPLCADKKGDQRLATLLLQEQPNQNFKDRKESVSLYLDQQQQPFVQQTSAAAAAGVRQSCRDEEDKKVGRFMGVHSENHALCDKSQTTPHEVGGEDEVSRCFATNNCCSRQAGERVYHVAGELICDPYGDEGVYSGFMSGTTGCPHGHGTMTYQNGRNYVGEWEHGRWHGQGCLVDPNGDVYEGKFDHDERHGHGCYKWANGDAYKGDFVEGKRHGKGVFTFSNGNMYKGDFVDDLFDGKGRYDFEGGFYEGEWKRGRYEGHGHVQYLDGNNHHGRFVGGVACAEGEAVNDDKSHDDHNRHLIYTAAMVRDGRDGGGGETGAQMGDDDATDYDGESRLASALEAVIQNNHHHHTKDARIESTLFVADGDTDHAARPATNNHHTSTVAFDHGSCNCRISTVSFAGATAFPLSYHQQQQQQQYDHRVAPPRRSSSQMLLSQQYPTLLSQPEHSTNSNSVVMDKQVLQSLMDRMADLCKLKDLVVREKDGEVEHLRQEVERLQHVLLAKQADINQLQSMLQRHEQTIAYELQALKNEAKARQQKLLETISCALSRALSTARDDEEDNKLVFASHNIGGGQATIKRQVKTFMDDDKEEEQHQPSGVAVGLTMEQLQQLLMDFTAAVAKTTTLSTTTIKEKSEPPVLPPP